MIPAQPRADTASAAEEVLFDRLKQDLPADYTVLHGVEWAFGPQDYEADFVVAHPKHGVLIVEVKGGVISVDGAADQWYSEDISGLRRRIKDPFRQARRTMYALRGLLEESPATGPYRYGVGRVVAFPDTVVRAADFPGVPREQIIDCNDLSHLRQAIERAWTASMPAGPSTAGVEALVRTLSPTVGVTLQDRIEGERKELQRLTAEQLQVLDMLAEHRRAAIRGVAGTGKTLLAIEQCRRSAQAGDRVLFVCYNRQLAIFVRRELTRDLGPLMTDVTVASYHDMAGEWGHRIGLPVRLPQPIGDGFESYYEEELPQYFLQAIEALPEERFDTIVVDEGQDFIDAYWFTLESLLASADSRLFLFYDENQRIFTRKGEYPIPPPPLLLTHNCRNTRRIHEEVMRYVQDGSRADCRGPMGQAAEPIPLGGAGEIEALRRVIHRLAVEERIPLADIVVLSLCMRRQSALREGERLGNYLLSWKDDGPNLVRCRSVYSFKGLEMPVVILAELDRADPAKRTALFYSAISRAQHHLVILGDLPR
jgi:hypothetical protein